MICDVLTLSRPTEMTRGEGHVGEGPVYDATCACTLPSCIERPRDVGSALPQTPQVSLCLFIEQAPYPGVQFVTHVVYFCKCHKHCQYSIVINGLITSHNI